jgi:hypothetical protein
LRAYQQARFTVKISQTSTFLEGLDRSSRADFQQEMRWLLCLILFLPAKVFSHPSVTPTSGVAPLHVNGSFFAGAINPRWTFGDGATSTSETVTHTYQEPGTYTLEVEYLYEDPPDTLRPKSRTWTITVVCPATDAPPLADALVSYPDNDRPLAVDFDASVSQDEYTLSYLWELGDGTTTTKSVASHTYPSAGPFDARLTVFDLCGKQDTVIFEVHPVPNEAPVPRFYWGQGEGIHPDDVFFDAITSSDDGRHEDLQWNLNDRALAAQAIRGLG